MILRKGMPKNKHVLKLQQDLTSLGYATNGVDGIFGNGTHNAVLLFQLENKLNSDGVAGKNTLGKIEELLKSTMDVKEKPLLQGTPWVDEAYNDLGVHEVTNEDKVHQMWRDAKLSGLAKFPATEIAWCSGAMCAWMERAGIRSPRTDGAKNWIDWGDKLTEPAYGCVVVFTRKNGGHVGVVVGKDKRGNLLTLGGNQGPNRVNVMSFAKSRVSGYRYPVGYTPDYTLPVGDATELSTNEV